MIRIRQRIRRIAVLLCSVSTITCAKDISTARKESGLTASQTIYMEMCNRVAIGHIPNDAEGYISSRTCRDGQTPTAELGPRVAALHARRNDLIQALSQILPTDVAYDLRAYLEDLLPLYDDGLMRAQTDALAAFIDTFRNDSAALADAARLGSRRNYTPTELAPGILAPALSYPRIPEMTRALLEIVRPGASGTVAWETLLEGAEKGLKNIDATPEDNSAVDIIRDLALRIDVAFKTGDMPMLVALRDSNGRAIPVGSQGNASDPFGPANSSGFDTFGRAIGSDGQPIYQTIDARFTLLNALVREAHGIITASPGLLFDLAKPMKNLMGMEERRSHTFKDGTSMAFNGYRVETSPALDLVHALSLMLPQEFMEPLAELNEQLLQNQPEVVAGVAGPLLDLIHGLQEEPIASSHLEPHNTLAEDLLTIADELATSMPSDSRHACSQDKYPLFDRVFDLLADPKTADLGPLFAKQMTYSDRINVNLNNINGTPVHADGTIATSFETPVLRSPTGADADTGNNKSILERLLYLVHDTNGVQVCNKAGAHLVAPTVLPPASTGAHLSNACKAVRATSAALLYTPAELNGVCTDSFTCLLKATNNTVLNGPNGYAACELINIPDVATFYMESIVGKAKLNFNSVAINALNNIIGYTFEVDTMDCLTDIDNMGTYPTPQALHRLLFSPQDPFIASVFDPIRGKHGTRLDQTHAGSMLAWELDDFLGHLKPLVEPFVTCGQTDILINMMDTLHQHWPSISSDIGYNKHTGLVRFESLAARLLQDSQFMRHTGNLLAAAQKITVHRIDGTTTTGREVLLDAVKYLITKRGDIAHRNENPLFAASMSPAKILFDALGDTVDALGTGEDARQAKQAATRALDQMLRLNRLAQSTTFESPRQPAIVREVLNMTRGHIKRHRETGDLNAWSSGLSHDVEDLLQHPITQTGVKLFLEVGKNPEAVREIDALTQYMLNQTEDPKRHAVVISTLVNMLGAAQDEGPFLRLASKLAPAFERKNDLLKKPDGLIQQMLRVLDRALPLDERNALPRIMALSVARPLGDPAPLSVIGDTISEVNRTVPGSKEVLSAEDLGRFLETVSGFLKNEENGIRRLYHLIATRHGEAQ